MHPSLPLIRLALVLAVVLAFTPALAELNDDPSAWIERVPNWHVPDDGIETLAIRMSAKSAHVDVAVLMDLRVDETVLFVREESDGTPLLLYSKQFLMFYAPTTGVVTVMELAFSDPAAILLVADENNLNFNFGTVADVFGNVAGEEGRPHAVLDVQSIFRRDADRAKLEVRPDGGVELITRTNQGGLSMARFGPGPDGAFEGFVLRGADEDEVLLESHMWEADRRFTLKHLNLPLAELREAGVAIEHLQGHDVIPEELRNWGNAMREGLAGALINMAADNPAARADVERGLEQEIDWDAVAHHRQHTSPTVRAVLDAWFERLTAGHSDLAAVE